MNPTDIDSIRVLSKPPKFYPAIYFSVYDYWEVYDSSYKYVSGLHDFKAVRGQLPYKWVFYEFNKEERYAVAHRDYTQEHIKELAHLCPCHTCTSTMFRLFGVRKSCDCCTGCLRIATPDTVSEAFVKMAEQHRRDVRETNRRWIWSKVNS